MVVDSVFFFVIVLPLFEIVYASKAIHRRVSLVVNIQTFGRLMIIPLAQSAGHSLAIPINASSIIALSSFCANSPTTIAGT